jgi:hypothetical protein
MVLGECKCSVDEGLHELLLKVFDVIEAFHAAGHLLSQFLDVRLVSHSPVSGL